MPRRTTCHRRVTSFVGRDHEMRTITALLHEERVVTLTGSGGCGKTRLALHAAAEVVDVHAGGTWWVDLAPVTNGANVPDQVAGAVGTQPAPGADTTALLVRYLRDLGPTLLILDNAEHVIDDVADVVDAIVQGCAEVHVLVTSREPLGVAGELVWRVPSLRAPASGELISSEALEGFEAARLFVDRARRVRPNLVLDDRATAAIVAICARLDGIPLALELAAARTRTVPLDRLASGLDNAFRLLTGGVRTAMPRQQTLLASIAWSVDLLDDVERAVLRRLAVFQGPFSLEAAEAVAADGAARRPVRRARRDRPPRRQEPRAARRRQQTAIGCWTRSASSRSTSCVTPMSWPPPVIDTRPGSPTGACRSDAASTTSTSARPTRSCLMCSARWTGPTTALRRRLTGSAEPSPAYEDCWAATRSSTASTPGSPSGTGPTTLRRGPPPSPASAAPRSAAGPRSTTSRSWRAPNRSSIPTTPCRGATSGSSRVDRLPRR